MSIVEFILTFVVIGVTSVVYSLILTAPGMLLHGVYEWLAVRIGDKPYLFNPIMDCPKCVAGQMALWYYIIAYWGSYSFITHISLVSLSIFFSLIAHKIYVWANN